LANDNEHIRGEFVVVVAGYNSQATSDGLNDNGAPEVGAQQLEQTEYVLSIDRVLKPLLASLPLSQAVSLTATMLDLPKNAIYDRALSLKQGA
jgi:16S rRNA C1402 (ribose-2'-O) methylase RsmI